MNTHRTPLPQFPEVFAEYTKPGQYRIFVGVVTQNGDRLDQLFKSIRLPGSNVTLHEYIAFMVTHADSVTSTTAPPEFIARQEPIQQRHLARRLLDPEDLGFQATAEIRDAARRVLGYAPCESVPSHIRSQQA